MKVICVTDRSLCGDSFLTQLEKICAGGADRIILREKDMDDRDYIQLASRASEICRSFGTPLSLHTHFNAAEILGAEKIHLPYSVFVEKAPACMSYRTVGVSVHSAAEAMECEKLGASYVTAGHIFPTDCKKGLPPRGTEFLTEVCDCVDIPVYAIGGITPENAAFAAAAGASGVCLMSSLMKSQNPAELIRAVSDSGSVL